MSNPTIELGGGKWATKPASLLAFNQHPEWGFNPKEFTVDRNSTATCIGSDGQIKTVAANEARIDYSNDPNGALLVEPQRTNLIKWSEDISNSYWSEGSVTKIYNQTLSPDGVSLAGGFYPTSTGAFRRLAGDIATTYSGVNTFSFYAKYNGIKYICTPNLVGTISYVGVSFDLVNGTVAYVRPNEGLTAKIEPQANGWFKCIVSSDGTGNNRAYLFLSDTEDNSTVTANGQDGVYIYGAQLEEGSTATSYIKTEGTTVTRLGDSYKQLTHLNTGNQFTAIFKVKSKTNGVNDRYLNINSTDYSDLEIRFQDTTRMRVYNRFDSSYDLSDWYVNPESIVALRVDENDITVFVDGSLIQTATMNTSRNCSGAIFFGSPHLMEFFKLYNQALTDQELIDLTTI
jgi:hypothetical protein